MDSPEREILCFIKSWAKEIQGEKHKPWNSAALSAPFIPATLNDKSNEQNYFSKRRKREGREEERNKIHSVLMRNFFKGNNNMEKKNAGAIVEMGRGPLNSGFT